ncbi:hypothetical protein ACFWPA_16600 [Rhodococcus sp. NPDC058505]|uniref:hypothetical protein n=1 Tax=unclassified Rhodococcus (in: high G+C Gram-positive bacteria) TaxID=192944 RepID=UPI00364A66E3
MAGNNHTPEADVREIIADLRSILGAKLVAYLAGIHSTDLVRRWADGTGPLPDRAVLDRLQVALTAARLITARDTPAVAQAWFQGRNPALGDQPPARLLRETNPGMVRDIVLASAAEFTSHGG